MNQSANKCLTSNKLNSLAQTLGITLDTTQLNIGGERSIMSPYKYVLTGIKNNTQEKIILKCSNHPKGIKEIKNEHHIQNTLNSLPFSEQELLMPEEIFFGKKNNYTVLITLFIEQRKIFTDYSLEQQFFMSLHLLEYQETLHATTKEHRSSIRNLFPYNSPDFYLNHYQSMGDEIKSLWSGTNDTIDIGFDFIKKNASLLNMFDRYLIHTDLVLHNLRINNRQFYLLDCVSFRLGNKYESWARFINFMEIHNPKLVPLLKQYIKDDRGETEYTTLSLMRIYKICFLMRFYAKSLQKTKGNLHSLTRARLVFWQHVLSSVIHDIPVSDKERITYYKQRNALRTEIEKKRQQQFTWV